MWPYWWCLPWLTNTPSCLTCSRHKRPMLCWKQAWEFPETLQLLQQYATSSGEYNKQHCEETEADSWNFLVFLSFFRCLLCVILFGCLLVFFFFVFYSKTGTRKIGHEKEEKEKLNWRERTRPSGYLFWQSNTDKHSTNMYFCQVVCVDIFQKTTCRIGGLVVG